MPENMERRWLISAIVTAAVAAGLSGLACVDLSKPRLKIDDAKMGSPSTKELPESPSITRPSYPEEEALPTRAYAKKKANKKESKSKKREPDVSWSLGDQGVTAEGRPNRVAPRDMGGETDEVVVYDSSSSPRKNSECRSRVAVENAIGAVLHQAGCFQMIGSTGNVYSCDPDLRLVVIMRERPDRPSGITVSLQWRGAILPLWRALAKQSVRSDILEDCHYDKMNLAPTHAGAETLEATVYEYAPSKCVGLMCRPMCRDAHAFLMAAYERAGENGCLAENRKDEVEFTCFAEETDQCQRRLIGSVWSDDSPPRFSINYEGYVMDACEFMWFGRAPTEVPYFGPGIPHFLEELATSCGGGTIALRRAWQPIASPWPHAPHKDLLDGQP
jgi:hypothetical protein